MLISKLKYKRKSNLKIHSPWSNVTFGTYSKTPFVFDEVCYIRIYDCISDEIQSFLSTNIDEKMVYVFLNDEDYYNLIQTNLEQLNIFTNKERNHLAIYPILSTNPVSFCDIVMKDWKNITPELLKEEREYKLKRILYEKF